MKKVALFTTLAALFIIPFLPLYVEGHLFFPFIAGKGFAFRILVEVATGAWILLALMDKQYRPKWSWTLVLYGALTVWMFIADWFAMNPQKAFWSNYERMDGWVTLMHVFLFFVVAGAVLSAGKLWKKWWLTVLAASALVAANGLLQVFGMAAIHQGGVRLDANFGNAAYLAAYLLFVIAISLWQAVESKGWLRYALVALAVVETVLLFMTATRGAILGFVAASALGAILWMFQSGKQGRRIGAGIIAGILVLAGGFFLMRHESFITESPIFSRIASISAADGSTRFTLWQMAWKGTLERPLTGWGHEGFNFIFAKYYDPSLYAQEPWFDRAHSVFVDWLVYGGFPALLLFLALLISGVVALYRAPISKLERVLLISALAAYAFQALFVFDNLLSYILSAAILAVAHAGVARPVKSIEHFRDVPEKELMLTAAPVVGIATLVIIWFVNVPGIVGGMDLIKATDAQQTPDVALAAYKDAEASGSFAHQEIREQSISYATQVAGATSVPVATRQAVLTFGIAEMEKELKEVPADPRLLLLYANGLSAGGDNTDAAKALEAAHELSPKKQALIIQQGLQAWKLGDTKSASSYFLQAFALAPSSPEYAEYAAAGEVLAGDLAKANTILLESYSTTTVDSQILRFAYAETKQYAQLIASSRLAVTLANGSAASRFSLARAYATAGMIAAARAEIEATIGAHPEAAAEGKQYLTQIGAQ